MGHDRWAGAGGLAVMAAGALPLQKAAEDVLRRLRHAVPLAPDPLIAREDRRAEARAQAIARLAARVAASREDLWPSLGDALRAALPAGSGYIVLSRQPSGALDAVVEVAPESLGGTWHDIPMEVGGRNVGVVQVFLGGPEEDLAFCRVLADHAALAAELDRYVRRVESEAMSDGLTGLLSRRFFERFGAQEVARAKRTGQLCSVVLVDLDRFAEINDGWGRSAGDACLEAAAACLRTSMRASDVLTRYEGDRFGLVLPGTDVAGAMVLAERIRSAMDQVRVPWGTWEIRLTCSAGCAAYPHHGAGLNAVVEEATHALVAAKEAGRHCVRGAEVAAESA